MAIPTTKLGILFVLMQAQQNLLSLQSNMRQNAQTWKTAAGAQSVPVATLRDWMNTAAVEYQRRLDWISAAQAKPALWTPLSAMFQALGGAAQDFNDVVDPLRAVADQLGPATKNNYSQINTICDQIIAAINEPESLWPL